VGESDELLSLPPAESMPARKHPFRPAWCGGKPVRGAERHRLAGDEKSDERPRFAPRGDAGPVNP